MKAILENPVEMIRQGAPRIIRSDKQLERYTDVLFELTSLTKPTVAEIETINLLSLLIDKYESERFPIQASSPIEVLNFLMEQNGLQQRDLMEELGSESNVSLILSGKRNLTLPHMQRLSRRFGVPASVFLESVADAA
jgi:HTH-type transcriptional regulator / antitoxin HigA